MQMASAQSLVVEALDGTTQVYDMAAIAQTDVWVWKDGMAMKTTQADSMTFVQPNLVIADVYHDGSETEYNYVDLGLTSGTKWATCNVGATKPAEFGYYYAWGETDTKETYYLSTYLDGQITSSSDYGTDKDALKGVINAGTQYDAAKANWGGKWRIPTKDQFDELMSQCYWVWTESYNNSKVKGYIVYKAKTSSDKGMHILKNSIPSSSYKLSDAHIFLPAAGYRKGGDLCLAGSDGDYRSSSLSDHPGDAWCAFLISNDVSLSDVYRYYGQSVRAVFK